MKTEKVKICLAALGLSLPLLASGTEFQLPSASTKNQAPVYVPPYKNEYVESLLRKQRPRRTFIGSTLKEPYAAYVAEVLSQVERSAEKNPPPLFRTMQGTLTLTFSLKSDGTLDAIEIDQSSSHPDIDQEIIQIFEKTVPFPPFPDGIRATTDILSITRTFVYDTKHQDFLSLELRKIGEESTTVTKH